MDAAKAQKILDAANAKIKVLEAEMEQLTGKDNKKARNAKSREVADMKKDGDYVDAERVLAGKEALQEHNKSGGAEKKEDAFAGVAMPTVAQGGYAAPIAIGEKKEDKKKKKADEAGGCSAEELKELEKLKADLITRKTELKAGGMSGGQMNKDEQIVAWVKRMNELKIKNGEEVGGKSEKKAEKKQKGGGGEAAEALMAEIEAYKEKLKSEFGYTKADINKDEDIMEMTKRLKAIKA